MCNWTSVGIRKVHFNICSKLLSESNKSLMLYNNFLKFVKKVKYASHSLAIPFKNEKTKK